MIDEGMLEKHSPGCGTGFMCSSACLVVLVSLIVATSWPSHPCAGRLPRYRPVDTGRSRPLGPVGGTEPGEG